MPDLPAGTVTFLFTDMEGSTRLLSSLGREGYGQVLAAHHRLLRAAFEEHRGIEVDNQGDAFFVVFRTAADAVAAAVAAQQALTEHEWPEGVQLRVRMGLHSGEALLEGNHYVGVAVHRAQRVSSAAHGGQILVSNSTRELIADELPSGVVVLRDLGFQQLKDLDRPEHVFQLEAEGLQRAFPPIRGRPPAPTGWRRWVPRTRLARAAAAIAALAVVAALLAGVLLTGGDGEPLGLGAEDALAAVDPGSGEVKDRFAAGATPSAVAVGEGAVWVLSSDDRTISRIDPASGERVPFTTSATPLDLATGAGSLWVGTGSQLAAAQTSGPVMTGLVQVAPGTRAERKVSMLPREGGAVSNQSLQHIAVADDFVWVIGSDYAISKVHRENGDRLATQRAFPADAIAASGKQVWAMQSAGTVAQLDPRTGAVRRRVKLPATALNALAVGEGAVWVTADADGELWRIDTPGGGRPASIPVGEGAGAVAVGGGKVWVANALRGTIVEVSPESNTVERTIPVGGTPRALAVGEGKVWVAVTADGGTVAASSGNEQGLPASFCDTVFYGGEGSPDFLIASDLALQGDGRLANVQMAQAIAFILRTRGFKAGPHRIGYQSCDDSIARTGIYDLDKCAANARAYSANEKVIGVIGTFNSPCALAEVPILNEAPGGGLGMISPTNTAIGLTRYGPGVPPGTLAQVYPSGKRNYVRLSPTDDYEAAGSAQLAKQLGARRVAVLSDGDRFFSEPLVESFRTAARVLGVSVTSVRRWDPNARSYRAVAERIVGERAQAVYLAGILDANGGQMVKDLRGALGTRVPLIGSSGFTPISFLFERAGPAARGMYVSVAGKVPQKLSPRARRFETEFGATQHGAEVELLSVSAAQAAEVLLDAIARSDGTRASVIEELFKTRVRNGILGTFSFDRNGDTTLNEVTILRAEEPGGGSTVQSVDGAAVDRVLVPPPELVGG